jgi:hypothetical protein
MSHNGGGKTEAISCPSLLIGVGMADNGIKNKIRLSGSFG